MHFFPMYSIQPDNNIGPENGKSHPNAEDQHLSVNSYLGLTFNISGLIKENIRAMITVFVSDYTEYTSSSSPFSICNKMQLPLRRGPGAGHSMVSYHR